MDETEPEKRGTPLDSEKNGNSIFNKKLESSNVHKTVQTYTRTFLLSFATREECQQKPAKLEQSVLKEISEAGIPIPQGSGRGHRREWDSDSAHSKSPQEVPEWRKDSWRPSSFGAGQPPLVQPPPGISRRGQEDDSSNNAISSSYPPRPANWDGGLQRASHDRHGTSHGAGQNYGPQGRRDIRHNDRPIRGHKGPDEDIAGQNVGNETGPRHGSQNSNTEGGFSLRPSWANTEATSDKGRDNGAIISSPPKGTDRPLGPPSRYQPPRSKQEDNPDRETFGDLDVSNTRQAELERKRREEFELMRRAQHRRNSEQKEREGEVTSRKHDIDSLWDSQSFSAESPPSVVPFPQGPRPSVPPGFGFGVRAPLPGAPLLVAPLPGAPGAPPGFNRTIIANQTSEALPEKVETSQPENVVSSHSEVGAAGNTSAKIELENGGNATEDDKSGKEEKDGPAVVSQASAVEEDAQPKNLGILETEAGSARMEKKGPLSFLGISDNSINVALSSGLPDQTSLILPPFLNGVSGGEKDPGSVLDRLFKMGKDDRHSKSESGGAAIGELMEGQQGKSDPELKASKFARWFSSSNDESTTELPVLSHVPQFPQGFPSAVGGDGNAVELLDKATPQSTHTGESPSPPPPFLGGLGALFALAGSNSVKTPTVGFLQPGAPVPGVSALGRGPVVFKSLEDIESSILSEAETASDTTSSLTNNSQESLISKEPIIQRGVPFFPPSNMTEKARESASLHLLSLLHKADADKDKDRTSGVFPGILTEPSPNILTQGVNIFEAELLKSGRTRGEANDMKLQETTKISTEDTWSLLEGMQARMGKEDGNRFENHLHDGGLDAEPEKTRFPPHAESGTEDALSFIDQFEDPSDSSDRGSVGLNNKGSSLARPPSLSGQLSRLDQNSATEGSDGGGKQADEFRRFFATSQPPVSLNGWLPSFVSGGPPNGGQSAEVIRQQFRVSTSSVEAPYSSLQFATPHGTIRKPTSSPFQGPSPIDILRQAQNHGGSRDQPPSLAQQYQQLAPFHRDSSGETFIPPFNNMHQHHHYSQGNQGNFPFPPPSAPFLASNVVGHGTNGGQFVVNQTHGGPLQDLPPPMSYHMSIPRPQLIHEIQDSSSSFNNPMHPYPPHSARHFQPSPPSLSGDKGAEGGLPQWLVGDGGWGRSASNGLSQRVAPSQMMGVEELERQLRSR